MKPLCVAYEMHLMLDLDTKKKPRRALTSHCSDRRYERRVQWQASTEAEPTKGGII
jgi:hypothetical protein